MVKSRFAGIILGVFLLPAGWAATSSPSLMITPAQPTWSDLTVLQKIILAPLCDEWDSLESYRQKKWLSIAEHFSAMTPDAQRRVQIQMQEWGKLTPAQREQARENYRTTARLSAEKKQELKQKWQEYLSLPAEEKEKLQQQVQGPQRKPRTPRLGTSATAVPLANPMFQPLPSLWSKASQATVETAASPLKAPANLTNSTDSTLDATPPPAP